MLTNTDNRIQYNGSLDVSVALWTLKPPNSPLANKLLNDATTTIYGFR